MLKTVGQTKATRTHFLSDPNTYVFLGIPDAAQEVLDIPIGVLPTHYDIVKQIMIKKKGKETFLENKYFAVALCGSINGNHPAYIVEVEYKEKKTSKSKVESEEESTAE